MERLQIGDFIKDKANETFIVTNTNENEIDFISVNGATYHNWDMGDFKKVTFQEAFSDEIESIVRQYKDALHQCQASHTQISIELERIKTAKEMDSIMNLESDLDYQKKIHEKDIDKLNEVHEANGKLKKEIENLKLERDQLVIDYDELERKQFDSELVQVSIKIEESIDDKNWCDLVSDTSISIENDTKYEVYKVWASHPRFIRVKLANKGISYEAMCNNLSNNNEYALKAENDSLKKALDKLSDLAVKFYLKSEGITI